MTGSTAGTLIKNWFRPRTPMVSWGKCFNPACFVGTTTPKAHVHANHAVSSKNGLRGQHPSTLCFRVRVQRNNNKDTGGNKKAGSGGGAATKGTSPIKVSVLESWFRDYLRRLDAQYLLDGFKYGFRIPAIGERKAFFARNFKSVQGMEGVVRAKIQKEVVERRVLERFQPPLWRIYGYLHWV